ncbi:Siderophore transporter [Fulvia fulva]|nr:Siderophore transporter [Fulvia fulva]
MADHKIQGDLGEHGLNDSHRPLTITQDGKQSPTSSITAPNTPDNDIEDGREVINPHGSVTKVEAFNRVLRTSGKGKLLLYTLAVSIGLTMFAYSMDQGTTYLFNAIAASAFRRHSSLGAINTAGQLVRSISKPFLGKLADITSRPTTYVVVLIFYAVGFAVAASGQSIAAYTIGTCFTAFGKSGIDLLGDIIVADMTSLQWRGFFVSLLGLPFIVTVFIDGFISDAFLPDKWRWGLGMFAIMVPVLLIPPIITLYAMQHKAKKLNMVSMGGSKLARTGQVNNINKKSYLQLAWQGIIDIDLLGLLLLGFGFALILLSLNLYTTAKGGFSNPSIIAMLAIGLILLITFLLFEIYIAPKPCCSRRILINKAFISALGIDIFGLLASGIHSLYFPSYIIVAKDWNLYNTNLFTNTVTLVLVVLGPIAGLILAKTHRFKFLMLLGAILRLIGSGIQLNGPLATTNTAQLVISQILSGCGSFTVVGARVGSQASVPHEDLASIIAQLSLWSSLASSIGFTIAGVVWGDRMLPWMREECPPEVSSAELRKIYGSIKTLRDYPWMSTIRECGVRAYQRTNGVLFIVAVAPAAVALVFCFLMPDYYLGKQHNLVSNTRPDGEAVEDVHSEEDRGQLRPRSALGRFWNMGA